MGTHQITFTVNGELEQVAVPSNMTMLGMLREKLAFDGVIISDSLTMRAMKDNYGIEEGAIAAVAAGHGGQVHRLVGHQPRFEEIRVPALAALRQSAAEMDIALFAPD